MTQPDWTVERTEVERVAREYREKGYEVQIEPAVSELPDFIREYRPDIIARSGKECVVIEVKQRVSDLDRNRLRTIAQRVESRPGWRFIVVSPGDAEAWPTSDIAIFDERKIKSFL